MHDGKWIDDLTAQTPLDEAARLVLSARLGVVGRCLPPALREAKADIEHVHQLRVATRRARAALDIFEDCLSAPAYKAAKKQLRRIRRAAGAARDWDVFLAALTGTKRRWPPRAAPGRDLLAGYALAQRGAAQERLEDLGDDYPDRFEVLQTEVLAGLSPRRAQPSLLQLAQTLMADLVQRLEQTLAGDLENYARLHQARIEGKRLRYAMEIFVACFPPAFRERLYPAVEQMQEILGNANDSHVALGHLQDVRALMEYLPAGAAKRWRTGVEAWQQFHEQRLQTQRRQFARWQAKWRKLDGIAAFLES